MNATLPSAISVVPAPGPAVSALIAVREVDAAATASRDIRDDKGTVTGQLSDESFAALMDELRGKSFFEASVRVETPDGEMVHRVQSAIVAPEQRPGAMCEMFAYLGNALFAKFFESER